MRPLCATQRLAGLDRGFSRSRHATYFVINVSCFRVKNYENNLSRYCVSKAAPGKKRHARCV